MTWIINLHSGGACECIDKVWYYYSMNLRELRQQRLMTQREVAERSGITVTTLSRIENGKVAPTFKTIRHLAEVFGISPQEMHEIVASAQLPLWAMSSSTGRGERGKREEE